MPGLLAEATNGPLALSQTDPSILVLVYAKDPISRAGVTGQLRAVGNIEILEPGDFRRPHVAVVVADQVGDEVLRVIRTIRRTGPKIVVITAVLDDPTMAAATGAGAAELLRRSDADYRQLGAAVRKAHWGEVAPLAATSRRLASVSSDFGRDWQPTTQALSPRDRDVLRFLAEGCDTAEIARELAYSEPTIKNVIQRLFEQLQAKNRPHVVAIALRRGII